MPEHGQQNKNTTEISAIKSDFKTFTKRDFQEVQTVHCLPGERKMLSFVDRPHGTKRCKFYPFQGGEITLSIQLSGTSWKKWDWDIQKTVFSPKKLFFSK